VQAGPNEVPAPENASVLEQVEDRPYTTAPNGGSQRLRLGQTDRVESYVAALDGGFVVTSTVDPFSSPSGQDLPIRLLRVTATETENMTPPDAELTADDELIRSGDGTLWLISGLRVWSSTAPYDRWSLAADATELGTVTQVRPALTGGGVIATRDSPGLEGFHFTNGNGMWEAFTFPGVSELGLLLVDGNNLMISAVVDGTRQVTIARTLLVVEQPQIQQTPMNDGEWDLPLLAPALDGDGFAGLTNVNGAIGFFESADGLQWSESALTDLPFGFFGTRLERIDGGFQVLGRVGLLEHAVFISADGLNWTRIEFDLPRSATAIEIESVSRTARATAVLGSLGWADDLSRTERLLLWWTEGSDPIDVPFRPCPETQGVCTLRSIAVVDDGVLATHLADQRFTVSKWTPEFGWEQLGLDQPLPEGPVRVQTTPAGVFYLGRNAVLGSVDNGVTWTVSFPVDGAIEVGPYQAISVDGTVALASGDGVLVVLDSTGQRRYAATGVQFGEVLAVNASAVIIRGITPDGAALVRLAAPAAATDVEPTRADLPVEALQRVLALEPGASTGYLTVYDNRLHSSDDAQTWTPVPSQVVGSETVLDLSRKDGEVTVLLASPGLTPEGGVGTWVSVSRMIEDGWEWLATAPVPLEVTEGSLNGTEWVVRAGPSLTTEDLGTADQLVNDLSSWLYAGSAASPNVTQIPMGASELSVQAVAVDGGVMFLSVELDFFVDSPPSLQLKRWLPGSEPVALQPGGRSVTEGDSLWLSADGMISLRRDNESWAWSPDTENFVFMGDVVIAASD
jgi:hypothetical protein